MQSCHLRHPFTISRGIPPLFLIPRLCLSWWQLEDPVPGWSTHTAGDLMLGTQLSCWPTASLRKPLHEAAWAPHSTVVGSPEDRHDRPFKKPVPGSLRTALSFVEQYRPSQTAVFLWLWSLCCCYVACHCVCIYLYIAQFIHSALVSFWLF